MRPVYISPLFTTPLGRYMLMGGAMTETVGCFFIFRMIKIDV